MLTCPKNESVYAILPMLMMGYDFNRSYLDFHKAENGDTFCHCKDSTLDKWFYVNGVGDLIISDNCPVDKNGKHTIEQSLYVPDVAVRFYFGLTLRELSDKFQSIVRFDDAGYKKENLPLVKEFPDAPAIICKAYNEGIIRCEYAMSGVAKLSLTRNITELIRLDVWPKEEFDLLASQFINLNVKSANKMASRVREDVYTNILHGGTSSPILQ